MATPSFNDDVAVKEKLTASHSRLAHSDLQDRDMILAISENVFNTMLETRFDQQQQLDKDRRLRDFTHVIPSIVTMTAKLKAPTIRMSVPSDSEAVHFFLNFDSGNFSYPNATEKQPVEDWSVAFRVKLLRQPLQSVPGPIQGKIAVADSQYTVSQVMLELSAAAVASIDWEASACPALSDKIQAAFEEYMRQYLLWFSAGPYSVLGYAIDSKHASTSRSGTFLTTGVTTRTKEYVPESEDYRQSFIKRGGLDSLLFLEMTGDRPFPDTAYDPSKVKNWVVPGSFASVTLCKGLFWDQYLLPHLEVLNRQCLDLANDLHYWVDLKDTSMSKGSPWAITDDPEPTSIPWESTDSGASFNWSGSRRHDENFAFVDKKWNQVTTKIANSLAWVIGDKYISMEASIKHEYHNQWKDYVVSSNALTNNTITLEVSWKGRIALNLTPDGQVQLDITVDDPHPTLQTGSLDYMLDFWNKIKDPREAAIKQRLNEFLAHNDLQNAIQAGLNQLPNLFVPGGGEFYFNNAAFSFASGLIFDLTYRQNDFAIEDQFRLRIDAPAFPDLHGRYLSVSALHEPWLADGPTNSALLTIDDGNLVIVTPPTPSTASQANPSTPPWLMLSGKGSGARRAIWTETSAQHATGFVFVTKEVQNQKSPAQKLEISVTGDKVYFSMTGGNMWFETFALAPGFPLLQLFSGDENMPHGYSIVRLKAVLGQ